MASPSALAVLRLNRSPALEFCPLAAINDASHVKRFTFLHYRLSVEQNGLLPRNENKVVCRSAADAISEISKALRKAGLST
jgi:hypothetical protein